MTGLSPASVGRRVVVRRRLPTGEATDVLGELVSLSDDALVVRRPDGALLTVDAATVLAARPVPPGPARLRPAVIADAEAIERLRVQTWRTAYRGLIPDAFLDAMLMDAGRRADRLGDRRSGVTDVIAESAGEIVGWAVGGPARDDDRDPSRTGELYACYVDPAWWGAGLGSRLLRRVLAGLRADGRTDVTLWVLKDNERAIRFYARHGFTPDGFRQQVDLGGPVTEIRLTMSI